MEGLHVVVLPERHEKCRICPRYVSRPRDTSNACLRYTRECAKQAYSEEERHARYRRESYATCASGKRRQDADAGSRRQ